MNLTNNIRKFYKISLMLFIVSVLVRIYFSNSLVNENKNLNELFVRKDELQKEISRLTYLENSVSSLNAVEQRAYNLGFVKMENSLLSLDIQKNNSIAYNLNN